MPVASQSYVDNRGLQKLQLRTGPGKGRLVGTASAANVATTITVTTPAGVAIGDLAVAVAASRNTPTDALGPDSDSSWTQVVRLDVGTDEWNSMYYKVLPSIPASTTLTIGTASGTQSGVMAISYLRGVSSLFSFFHGFPGRFTTTAKAWTYYADTHERGMLVMAMVSGFSASDFTFSEFTQDVVVAVGGENPRASMKSWQTRQRTIGGTEALTQSGGYFSTIATNIDMRFWSNFQAVFV